MSYLTELEKLKKLQEEERKKKKQTEAKTKAKAERASKGTEARSFEEEYAKLRQERLVSPETQRHQQWAARSREDSMKTGELPVRRTATGSRSISTTLSGTSRPDNRTWFRKGALEDGYQAGDVAKTIIGTFSDWNQNMTTGALGLVETVVDTGATILAHGSRLVGADGFTKDVEDFIKKDIIDEEKLAGYNNYNPYANPLGIANLVLNGGKSNENSVLGEKSDSLVQTGGQLVATAGLQKVGVPWWVTSAVSSFGSEVDSALNQGATLDEATVSGAVSTGAEILTEKLFGGSGLGEKGLINLDPLTKGISNKVLKALADYGIDLLTEGSEEVITSVFQNLGTALYKEENLVDILASEEAIDGYIESFIGGAVLSGGMNLGKAVNSAKTGRDYRSGLTKNEQAVFDKEYQDRIAEAEKAKGKKLTGKEKTEIFDQIRNNLEKGYISTDTIESVLGGESYKGYQSVVEQEKALKSEIEALENTPDNSITVKQRERLNEARQQLKELDLKGAKSNLFSEVDKLTANDTMLRESYNEKTRKGQAFEADLSKYDAKQQETVKRAIDSGILNNTNRTHEFVDMIAKLSADKGVPFDFTNNQKLKESGFALEGVVVNGFVNENGVTININSAKALNSVVGHEITHVLEGTDLYAPLSEIITQHAKSKGEYDSRLEAITKLYEGRDANIEQELVADLVGDYLFSDPDFIRSLSTEHRNVFQKLYDEIKYLCKVATAGSKEARELEKVKKVFQEAYRAETKNPTADGGVKYSLGLQNSTNAQTQYDYTKSFEDQLSDYQKGRIRADDALVLGATPDVLKKIGMVGLPMTINQKHIGDALNGTYKGTPQEVLDHTFTPKELATLPEKIADPIAVIYDKRTGKANASESTVDVIVEMTAASGKQVLVAVQINGNGRINGIRIDTNKVATVHGNTDCLTRLVDAINENEKGNIAVFYINNVKTTKVLQRTGNPIPSGLSNLDGFINSINDPASPVKSRISDVTESQQFKRWFGDWKNHPENASKVVNSDGTPKVMYHGSPEEFTVFDRSKAKSSGLYGRGFYFTDSKDQAGVYGNAYSVYLNVKHPLLYGGETVSREQVRSFLEAVAENEDYSIENYGTYDVDAILDIVMGSQKTGDAFQIIQDINATAVGDMVEASELFNSINGTEFDGIIVPTETVVFQPEQIKSATDNIGTFDGSNPDIRYSLSSQAEGITPVGNGIYGKDIALAPVREDIAQIDSKLSLLEQGLTAIANEVKKASTEPKQATLLEQALTAISNKDKQASSVQTPTATDRGETADAQTDSTASDPAKSESDVNQAAPSAESMIDKNDFISRRASQLYEEIRDLKKGVRASQSLGYLLDHGYEWSSIKTALLNIRDNPNQVVNENSAAESVAREMINGEYENAVYELNQPGEVTDDIRTKMQHIQAEISNNEKLRAQANADYDSEIAAVQAEYDGKKNKNTLAANNLLRRLERLKRLKNQNDANYAKRIGDLTERLEKMIQPTYKTAMQRKKKQAQYTSLMENLVGDTSTWRDKKFGISYKLNTLRRNLRDIVRDASGKQDIARADAIYDELQGNYNRNEAQLKIEDNRIKAPIAELGLNNAEYTYAHMLGEFQYNPDSTLTEDVVKEYYEKHKQKIDTEKVEKAIEESRKIFDDLIVRMNERLREQGMKEIPYRKGYFPHFTNPKQGLLAKIFNWKPVDNEIPTSIAGITETFNPERSWQTFSKERKSDITDYNLAKALDSYVHGALDWIYHIEDIQKRRALENYIRYIHSDEGIKARIDAIRNNEEYDADEMQDQIDLVYAEARNPLGNFVTDLRAGTNTLAAKKSSMDRELEEQTNRKIYSVMTNLNNRINANMVVGSLSSALTNFIPITQSWTEVSPWYSLKAMGNTIRATARDDGMIRKSTFLTNRLIEEEKLYKTGWDKASDKAALLMNAIDSFTSQTVWRSMYQQCLDEGMSENAAIKRADQFAENVIAGRSRGNMPTIFDAKNPITKIFTAFQLEVSNQYGYMLKDAPQDSTSKAKLIKGYATMFLGSYLYNALYSSLVGRNAAFDPISIIEELIGDLSDDEEDEEAILNLAENIAQEIPFVGGLLGGGRVPISSALPYSGEYEGMEKLVSDIGDNDWASIGKEMLQPLYYLALPFGGGQIKKTNEGIGMFTGDKPVTGSYTGSGNLRFPVEKNAGNVLQAALFGQYASRNARDYFDNHRSPLQPKQIQEFADVDIPIQDYWGYREGLAKCNTIEEKFDYIAGLDLPVDKKNILINNVVDRKTPVDMQNYEQFGTYEEFDFSIKNPGKYEFFRKNNISYKDYSARKDAYNWAYENPGKYTMSKAISSDFLTYYGYKKDMTALDSKDENGVTVNGLKKDRVIEYINNLDIDYGSKIILYRSMYDSAADCEAYNGDIVDYLNSRDDISYDEMVTILKELGFEVAADGLISW